jgi:hypothetical protein
MELNCSCVFFLIVVICAGICSLVIDVSISTLLDPPVNFVMFLQSKTSLLILFFCKNEFFYRLHVCARARLLIEYK